MLITIEASKAATNDSMNIPFTSNETRYNKIALITNVNRPNVIRFIGKVINIRIGLINTFSIPNKADATMIDVAVSAENPLTIEDAK